MLKIKTLAQNYRFPRLYWSEEIGRIATIFKSVKTIDKQKTLSYKYIKLYDI